MITSPPDNVLVSLDSLLALRFQSGKYLQKTRKKTTAVTAGSYASPIRGRGMDFSEVRLYQPGDDIRSIDWRVTARTGKAHTKLFTEERERPVFFVIDTGPSMQFGTQVAFKSVIAAKIAGILAWSAMSHGDRVGGIIFSGKDHEEIKPNGSKRGILTFFRKLVEWNEVNLKSRSVSEASDFYDVAVRLKRVARPGSVVYVISDFNNMDRKSELYFSSVGKHCELIMINVYDAMEKFSPPSGNYMVTDGQQFEKLSIGNKAFSDAFQNEFSKREDGLKNFCMKSGIRFLSICTSDDLQQFLRLKLSQS